MTICAHCGQRKGKRDCPALGAVCSKCCGVHRTVAIACPPDCEHLRGTREDREFSAVLRRLIEFVSYSTDPWKQEALASLDGDSDELNESAPGHLAAYLAFGYEDGEGRRGFDWFLEGESLDASSVTAVEGLRHAFVSVFEILEVRGGTGLRLHDLLTDEEIFLHDDVAARRCRTGTFLLSWLAPLRGRVAQGRRERSARASSQICDPPCAFNRAALAE